MQEHSIIATGGKQYLVKPGAVVQVEKLPLEIGNTATFTDLIEGKKVTATVLEQGKSKTVRVIKFKNKTRSIRRHGQRQAYTALKIEAVA